MKSEAYLHGIRGMESIFVRGSRMDLTGYSDADYPGESNGGRSVSGTAITLRRYRRQLGT